MFTKEMVILDIVADYPDTEEIFRTYDEIAGECVMCHYLFDNLEVFALLINIDLDNLIMKLNDKVFKDQEKNERIKDVTADIPISRKLMDGYFNR